MRGNALAVVNLPLPELDFPCSYKFLAMSLKALWLAESRSALKLNMKDGVAHFECGVGRWRG